MIATRTRFSLNATLSNSWQTFNYGQIEKLIFGCHVKDNLVFAYYILKKTCKETVQDIGNYFILVLNTFLIALHIFAADPILVNTKQLIDWIIKSSQVELWIF